MTRRPHNAEVIVEARKLLKDMTLLGEASVPEDWYGQVQDFLARTERFEKGGEG